MDREKINIIYMGTPEYARVILQRLHECDEFDIALVLTQPDRPVGRKRVMTAPPVKLYAQEKDLEFLQPHSLKDGDLSAVLRGYSPDFIVVAAYGQILPKEILSIAPCINLHASLLPEYRGASPVQNALLNGDLATGVTAMLMEEGLDSGPVLAYSVMDIEDRTTLSALMQRLSVMAAELIVDTLLAYERLHPIPQIDALSTHCRKIRRGDGEVRLERAVDVYRRYRAFEGWPGVYLPDGLKLLELELLDEDGEYEAGEIVHIGADSMDIGCRRGLLRVHTLQPKSKRAMSAKAYALGRGLRVGDTLI